MLKIHWFLPTGGDSRDVTPTADGAPVRQPSIDYLSQIARACDQLGFDAVLTPCGTGCEDAWVTTAMLVPLTTRLRFLVAFRPGLLSPTLAAQMASTYQRLSGGRVILNLVTGAEPRELHRFGDFADKDARYARTGEFIEVLRGAWADEPFDHQGEHYRVEAATTREQPTPQPEIYFGGASPAAEAVAAAGADVYLAWGEPPAMVAERVDRMRKLAADQGRTLRFGIRFHAIARPTSEEAWAEAARLQAGMSPEAIAAARADFETTQSEGQRRMAELNGSVGDRAGGALFDPADPRSLEIHPNVWSGIGLVRGGAGTALVGSFEEVADRIAEYAEVGFEDFILSGYPHLEEAWWVGEGVLPELRRRGLVEELTTSAAAPVFHFR
jgi:alkanesulfonate monooxygenase